MDPDEELTWGVALDSPEQDPEEFSAACRETGRSAGIIYTSTNAWYCYRINVAAKRKLGSVLLIEGLTNDNYARIW